jgi:tetratricopeptide (TPR) repeat protein
MVPEAAEAMEQYVRLEPRNLKARLQLADYYRLANNLDSELECLMKAAATITIQREDLLTRIGQIYERLGLRDAAAQAYDAALAELPIAVEPRLALGRMAADDGDAEAARDQARRVLQIKTDNRDAKLLEARAALIEGNLDEASVLVAALMDVPDGDVLTLDAMVKFRKGEFVDAMTSFEQAATSGGGVNEQYWINLGIYFLAAGSGAQADLVFQTIDRLNPAGPWGPLGQALSDMVTVVAEPDATEGLIDDALARDPNHAYALYARARFRMHHRDDAAGALDSLEQSIRADDRFYPAYLEYAWILQRSREYAEADALLDLVRRAVPHLSAGRVLLQRGLMALRTSAFSSARGFFDQADALDQPPFGATLCRAWLLYTEDRRVEEALAALNGLQSRDSSGIARMWADEIQRAELQKEWQDEFNRAAGAKVGNGWTQVEGFGVDVSLTGTAATWSGTQSQKDMGMTRIEREVSGTGFLEVSAVFSPEENIQGTYGLRLVYFKAPNRSDLSALVRVGPDGKVEYGSSDDAGKRVQLKESSMTPVGKVHLRIALEPGERERMSELVFYVNGQRVGAHEFRSRDMSKTVTVSLFGQAARGIRYGFDLESVNIVTVEKKK